MRVNRPQASGRCGTVRLQAFTMLEMIVILFIVAMITAIATPRIIRGSKRMTVENALTSIRNAVTETGLRARANGRQLSLTLKPDDHAFTVSVSEQNLSFRWTPPWNAAFPQPSGQGQEPFFISAKPSYDLSSNIEWLPENDNYDADNAIVYYFYPDGQASGTALRFDICGRHFQFDVDRMTGVPLIMELDN